MVVIVDYGVGNPASIKNMLKKIGVDSIISSSESDIENANKLILPGVGSFNSGVSNIVELGISNILNKKVIDQKTPILGICLGMQLLSRSSEEGILQGLGWIDATTVKFNFINEHQNLKVPNMGWNYITIKKESKLFFEMYENPKFYFVHSYYVDCYNTNQILASANYGINFTCSVEKDNILGVQFHPEKSHKYGIKLLKNFIELY